MKKTFPVHGALAAIIGICILLLTACSNKPVYEPGESLSKSDPIVSSSVIVNDYRYFVRSFAGVSDVARDVVVEKLRERISSESIVYSLGEADVVIVADPFDYNVIAGTIYVKYTDGADEIISYIAAHTVDAIVQQKEEYAFGPLARELQGKLKNQGVSIRNAVWTPEKDYYRFLLGLRMQPEAVDLMRQVEQQIIVDKEFSSDYGIRINGRADFTEINDFLKQFLLSTRPK